MRLSTIRKNARVMNGQLRRPVKMQIRQRMRLAKAGYTDSELATASLMIEKLRRGQDVRSEKVAAARTACVAGDLDDVMMVGLKLDVAVERMLDEVLE
jgi:hypothetical protein